MIFLINSAINNDPMRLAETLDGLESIWRRYPLSDIWIAESSRHGLSSAFVGHIPVRARLFTFWDDEYVKRTYQFSENLGFVKTAIESYMTRELLRHPLRGRVYKLSGRYQLTDDFNPDAHVKVTFSRALRTGFSVEQCGTTGMYMTRLYSFDSDLVPVMRNVLSEIQEYHWQKWKSGGVFDLEHGFYKFLPRQYVHEVDKIGVKGRIGHLSTIVED